MSDNNLEKYEWKNTTGKRGSKPEVIFIEIQEGKMRRIDPGAVVYLTDDQVRDFIAEGDIRFTDGRLRKSGTSDDEILDIDVCDSMTDVQVAVFVKNCTDINKFKEEISRLTSTSTLSVFLDCVEENDKPYSFYKVLVNKIDSINSEINEKIRKS